MRIFSIVRTTLFMNAALAGALFIKMPNGSPLLPGGDQVLAALGMRSMAVTPGELIDNVKAITPVKLTTQTFYRWKDEKGEWHFSDTRPEKYQELKLVTVRTDTNIISSAGYGDEQAEAAPAPGKDASTLGKAKMLGEVVGKFNGTLVDQQMQGKAP